MERSPRSRKHKPAGMPHSRSSLTSGSPPGGTVTEGSAVSIRNPPIGSIQRLNPPFWTYRRAWNGCPPIDVHSMKGWSDGSCWRPSPSTTTRGVPEPRRSRRNGKDDRTSYPKQVPAPRAWFWSMPSFPIPVIRRARRACLPSRRTAGQLFEEREHRGHDHFEAVPFPDCVHGCPPQVSIPGWVGQHPDCGRGETLDIEEVPKDAVLPVSDHFLHRGSIRAEDRASTRHRLQQGPAQHEGHSEVDVQIAQVEQLEQGGRRDGAQEPDPVQVVVVLLQNVLLETLLLDVLEIRAVFDRVPPSHEEDHVGIGLVDQLGHPHENVEAPHGLEAARYVRHEPGALPATARNGLSAPEAGVDSVVDHPDLGPVGLGEEALLEVGRRIPGGAVLEMQHDHGVLDPVAEHGSFGDRPLRTEVDRRPVRAIEVLEIVDHWDLGVQLPKEEGGSPPGMADDEVGADRISERFQRLVHGLRMGQLLLEVLREKGARLEVRLHVVLDLPDPVHRPRGFLRDERAAEALLLDQVSGDVPELPRECGMDEQHVHLAGQGFSGRTGSGTPAEVGRDHPYRAISWWPARPGGGPTSTPPSSTHACASLSLGSSGSPITSSGRSPWRRRRRYKTIAAHRHRAFQGPSRSTCRTIFASLRGSTLKEVAPPDPGKSAITSGRGRRFTATYVVRKRPQMRRARASLAGALSRRGASLMRERV